MITAFFLVMETDPCPAVGAGALVGRGVMVEAPDGEPAPGARSETDAALRIADICAEELLSFSEQSRRRSALEIPNPESSPIPRRSRTDCAAS